MDGDPSDPAGARTASSRPGHPGRSPPRKTPATVSAPPSVDELDDHFLDAFYDPGSHARGRAYADEDRVSLLSSTPGAIKAVCRGSGRATYVVQVRWTGWRGSISLDDTCSCPRGGGCKHCVATILAARQQTVRSTGLATGAGAHLALDWRRTLAELAGDDGTLVAAPTGLALQVAVVHPTPSRFVATSGPRVTIRPMRRGKGAGLIKTGASWRDLTATHNHHLDDVDALQRAALRSFVASGPTDLGYTNPQTAPLARFGPDVWHQLERAVDVGVELIGEHPGDVVELSSTRAVPVVDVTADEHGHVTLTTSFTVDDDSVLLEDGRSGLLGTPPHGLWTRDGGHLTLLPLAAPLHPAVARLAATATLTRSGA